MRPGVNGRLNRSFISGIAWTAPGPVDSLEIRARSRAERRFRLLSTRLAPDADGLSEEGNGVGLRYLTW
ncbi:hypothetical protein GWI33_017716 [Rhynchophorus ferrugineus]|uniref:Uncharacterized protein n=1 Tax=Rhynchophorus ferrugineus TaxID=354439 RepID=A0A834I1H2_RHYFE|nr:hypothetical protein GWI33_017716 [Rhynchophorus ferrugineus]